MLRQFLMFALVGAIGTAGHYLVLITLKEAGLASVTTATSCGFAVGALINYGLNYRFTFGSGKRHTETLPKFLLVAASGALLNYALMWWLSRETTWHYLLAQVLTTAVVLVWNYLLNRAWTFAHRPAQQPAPADDIITAPTGWSERSDAPCCRSRPADRCDASRSSAHRS